MTMFDALTGIFDHTHTESPGATVSDPALTGLFYHTHTLPATTPGTSGTALTGLFEHTHAFGTAPISGPPINITTAAPPILNTSIPHFSYPLQLSGTALAVNEQDTIEDVGDCVIVLLLTPRNTRMVLPVYGVDDFLFTQLPLPLSDLIAEIGEWEPRATVALQEQPNLLSYNALAHYIVGQLSVTQGGVS